MKVKLHYGKEMVTLEIPEGNIEEIIQPWQDEQKKDNVAVLQRALAEKEVDNRKSKIPARATNTGK